MFAGDPDCQVDQMEVVFMHPKINDYWDWPKVEDRKTILAKYVFFGPCTPEPPKPRCGFKFAEEETAKSFYKIMKNFLRN